MTSATIAMSFGPPGTYPDPFFSQGHYSQLDDCLLDDQNVFDALEQMQSSAPLMFMNPLHGQSAQLHQNERQLAARSVPYDIHAHNLRPSDGVSALPHASNQRGGSPAFSNHASSISNGLDAESYFDLELQTPADSCSSYYSPDLETFGTTDIPFAISGTGGGACVNPAEVHNETRNFDLNESVLTLQPLRAYSMDSLNSVPVPFGGGVTSAAFDIHISQQMPVMQTVDINPNRQTSPVDMEEVKDEIHAKAMVVGTRRLSHASDAEKDEEDVEPHEDDDVEDTRDQDDDYNTRRRPRKISSAGSNAKPKVSMGMKRRSQHQLANSGRGLKRRRTSSSGAAVTVKAEPHTSPGARQSTTGVSTSRSSAVSQFACTECQQAMSAANGGSCGLKRNTKQKTAAVRGGKGSASSADSPSSSPSTFLFKDAASLAAHVKKQHTRPYVCVFDFAGCGATFASKNEWKRHVSSQHLLLHYWLCTEGACANVHNGPASKVGKQSAKKKHDHNEEDEDDVGPALPDGAIFNRKDLYTQHLRRMHTPVAVKRAQRLAGVPTVGPPAPSAAAAAKAASSASSKKDTGALAANKDAKAEANQIIADWEETVRRLQREALRDRCALPDTMACPAEGCDESFHGPAAWDMRMEHVARHLDVAIAVDDESSSGRKDKTATAVTTPGRVVFGGENDPTLMAWATSPEVRVVVRARPSDGNGGREWVLFDPLRGVREDVAAAAGIDGDVADTKPTSGRARKPVSGAAAAARRSSAAGRNTKDGRPAPAPRAGNRRPVAANDEYDDTTIVAVGGNVTDLGPCADTVVVGGVGGDDDADGEVDE